jgi:hypothetical protein
MYFDHTVGGLTSLPEQPIFSPMLNAEYAAQIARGWNTKSTRRREPRSSAIVRTRGRRSYSREAPDQHPGFVVGMSGDAPAGTPTYVT